MFPADLRVVRPAAVAARFAPAATGAPDTGGSIRQPKRKSVWYHGHQTYLRRVSRWGMIAFAKQPRPRWSDDTNR